MFVPSKFRYHHVGIPTSTPRAAEEYTPIFKQYASGYFESAFGVEWLRFEEGSSLPELIRTVPHVAFVVDALEEAISEYPVIFENRPADGVHICFVEVDGAPVEFLQFDRPEQDVWPTPHKHIFGTPAGGADGLHYAYHHFGICHTTPGKNEMYLDDYKFFFTDHEANPFGIQWMRYEADCSLPELVTTQTHVAFQVSDLEAALEGKKVIIAPNSPSKGILVAFIEENGAPIELLQVINDEFPKSP